MLPPWYRYSRGIRSRCGEGLRKKCCVQGGLTTVPTNWALVDQRIATHRGERRIHSLSLEDPGGDLLQLQSFAFLRWLGNSLEGGIQEDVASRGRTTAAGIHPVAKVTCRRSVDETFRRRGFGTYARLEVSKAGSQTVE